MRAGGDRPRALGKRAGTTGLDASGIPWKWFGPNDRKQKKPAWSNTCKVFDHAGLLVNGSPGNAEVSFI
jgi:hypothetical protein